MLRRLPTARLLLLIVAVIAVLGGGTAIAMAALGGNGPTPPPKPLDAAIHDAVTAQPAPGVTARITFTNRLIDKSSLPGGASNPLLSGATGRLWAANDGRLRLELQSSSGDAQVVSDGKTVTIFDGTQNTAYKITLPANQGTDAGAGAKQDGPPSLQKIDELLQRIARTVDVSGATPSNVAGRPAYTVRVSPKHDGGLIGAAQLAWDAANGTPLRAAVYAAGDPNPVLELRATDISFGPVAATDLQGSTPAGTKVTNIDLGGKAGSGHDAAGGADHQDVTGPAAVARQLPFTLSAPDTLVGLPRHDVRLISTGEEKGALVTYGRGLGGIAVLEQAAPKGGDPAAGGGGGGDHQLSLPKISIDGASGQELSTALGTVVRFERGGVQYTVIGSVPPAAAEAAARAL
jgi:outer membrane lipoprotein-sorting protein